MTSGKFFKLICVAIYAAIVGGCYYYVNARTQAHSKTTRKIEAFERISLGDVVSIDSADLVDRFATHEIASGRVIAARDVSQTRRAPTTQLTLAVTFTIPRPATGRDAGNEEFQVCLDGKVIGKAAKPLTAPCNSEYCRVTVPIEDMKELGMKGAEKRAYAITSEQKCDGS